MDKVATKRSLYPSRMQLAAHNRQIWDVVPESGVTIEDLKQPQFWAHCSRQLTPGDRIEVRAEEGTYFAELYVLDAGQNYAKVAVLRECKLEIVEPGNDALMAGHSIEWSGPHTKFRVRRDVDKKIIKDSFPTRADALTYLVAYGKSVAA